MIEQPEISICIPAYKNTVFLARLLDSIAYQSFKNYEVVISDDSNDSTVEDFVSSYRDIEDIRYFRNVPALGTPENWNEGIRQAKGKWIKLMHDDDWFTSPNALQFFSNASAANPSCSFFFSAFQNVMHETGEEEVVRCSWFDLLILKWSPLHLFKRVYVGNPSCTFIKGEIRDWYDSRFKFVVDFEYYIRLITKFRSYQYIDEVLINVGFNNEQVTKYTFLVPTVQVPENLLLLEKLTPKILRNILVYDYYWRMFRNLKIRNLKEIKVYYSPAIHPLIEQMVYFQRKNSLSILKIGVASKILMLISFLRSQFTSVR